MDMDFGTIIMLATILSVVGPLLTWGIVVWVGVKAAEKFQDADFGGGGGPFGGGPFGGGGQTFGLDPQFMASMQQIQRLIQEAQANAGSAHYPSGQGLDLRHLPPHIQTKFNRKLAQAQRDMRAMDKLGQQRADMAMSDMLGQASSAGIDVSRWKLGG